MPGPTPDDAAAFARISQDLLAEPDEDMTLQRVVELAVATIPDCDHAGISMRRDGRVQTPVSTDPLVDLLDQLQYDLNEGPGLDAIWVDDSYRIPDTTHEDRWPNWAPKAAAMGVNSVLSVRLSTPSGVVGSLNLYSKTLGGYDREAVLTAHIYASHASSAIALTSKVQGLQTALQTRHTIGLAQGMLMLRYGLNEDAAFQVLRRLSSHKNVKLRDVARQVIDEFHQTGTLA